LGRGLLGRARALPEDHLAAAGHGEHELRAVLAAALEHEVDRRPSAGARPHRNALDDFELVGPLGGSVAVQLRGARPDVAHLERDPPFTERKVDEERQRRVWIRVARNHELHDTMI
jgi:hypothetical protein